MSTRWALQKWNGEQNISWISDVYWVSTRWALGEYWQRCLRRCALGEYCTRWRCVLGGHWTICVGESWVSIGLRTFHEGVYYMSIELRHYVQVNTGLVLDLEIFINVCTNWAFHFWRKMTEQKAPKLCDQMGLDKSTSKLMFNLCLCRWKINQNESNHWSHLLMQLLEIHTTQAFV